MIIREFVMIKDNVFKQLEHDNRFNSKGRSGRGLSLITDKSFNDFYCELGHKPVQTEKSK